LPSYPVSSQKASLNSCAIFASRRCAVSFSAPTNIAGLPLPIRYLRLQGASDHDALTAREAQGWAMLKRSSPWDKPRLAGMPESRIPEYDILKPSPINALPDSLLLDVFEVDYYQVSDQARAFPTSVLHGSDHERPTTRSILQVCRRWNAIAIPLLYRRIRIELRKPRVARTVSRLLSTLQTEPQLRLWTREVDILLDGLTVPDFSQSEALQLVQLLRFWETGLRNASIHGCIDAAKSRSILLQLGSMSLEDFTCSGYYSGISLSFLLTHFELSRLRKLSLHRVRLQDYSGSQGGSSWPPITDEQVALPLEGHHPSELKELNLSDPYLQARTLDILLKQPKALERLSMALLMHSTNANTYTVAAIERLLHYQRHSLRYIELGHMCQVHDGLNLTNMTALETLKLNESTIFHTCAVKAASRLAAPKLKHFIIDFSTEDQHEADPMSDMQQTTSWLQQFVATKKAVLPKELHTLEEIELDFYPELRYGVTWESVRQPWQSLEQTRAKLESSGVRLNYPKPITDDEDWHRYLDGSWEPPESPDIMDEIDASDSESDIADMRCSDDVDNSEGVASFTEHSHDPAQTRLCRSFGVQMSCVH